MQVVQPIPTLSQTCTSADFTEPVSNTDSSKEWNMNVDPQVTKQSSQHLTASIVSRMSHLMDDDNSEMETIHQIVLSKLWVSLLPVCY